MSSKSVNSRHPPPCPPPQAYSSPFGYCPSDLLLCNKGLNHGQRCNTMIDPASSWFKMVELLLVSQLRRQTVSGKELPTAGGIFDKTFSDCIAKLVNETWLCGYPQCWYLSYNNGSEFKLPFEHLCESYGIQRNPTMVKNPQQMLHWNACIKSLDRCYIQLILICPNQLSRWYWCLSWKCGMGNLLYLSYSTYSLTMCSYFWTRHARWCSVCSCFTQNWRTQAITDWSWQSVQE